MSDGFLDMSLDDIIKKNKQSNSRTRPGPNRRFSNRPAPRSAPYSVPKAPELTWKHDVFGGDQVVRNAARASSIETGTKLFISNLDYGVSNDDIKELFADVGDLKRHALHYDRSGRSKGTAEVVFSRRQDALSAIKRYNNVQLDGKPMKIEIVGTNVATPAAAPPPANNFIGNANGVFGGDPGRNGGFRRPRGGAGGGRGSGRGQGWDRERGRGEKPSLDDLDADLDKYYANSTKESMET